jgi:EAL domain-containing protein (putative c-di-GMP-specific phosphodiesterase class I)
LRSISTHFQPIVSVKRKAVVGVEALTRSQDPASGAPVPPPLLFQWAREEEQLMRLDQLCQEQSLASFAGLPRREPELLLFMNVEASLLDQDPDLSLLRAAHQAGVKPCNIVIEVNETKVLDPQRLTEFVERHRRLGFLIAMDDLGSGHSGLQRWPVLKPDIIKLDRSIVDGVAGNFFAQELLRSLIALGRQTGALILAEGVETQADVTACMDLGVDLFQGYFFAKPAPIGSRNLEQALQAAVGCAAGHKDRSVERMQHRRNDYQVHSKVARGLALQLIQAPADSFDAVLRLMPTPKGVESLMLLDERGLQVTSVAFPNGQSPRQRATLFQAPRAGADHSDRDYFYGLTESGTNRDFFLTESHLSVATGEVVRTLSHYFQHPSGANFIACLDLRVQTA